MKLLLDENISARIVKYLLKQYPESTHIDYLQMQGCTDSDIWKLAKANDYIIVSKDNDFRQRSFLFGAPPKVIWLNVGNHGTQAIKDLILTEYTNITTFYKNKEEGLLVLNLD